MSNNLTPPAWKRTTIRALEWAMPYPLWLDLRFELKLLMMRGSNALNPFFGSKVKRLARMDDLRLHFACGARYLDGWVNLDGPTIDTVDLKVDLRRRTPLPDHRADMIFCEHFLEHLSYPNEAIAFLKECLRLLKPHGILRVSLPDAGKYLAAYAAVDRDFFDRERPQRASYMAAVNDVFRQGGQHKFAYDYDTLADLFRKAGFGQVERSAFNCSKRTWFDSDSPARAGESLYVEGIPASS